NDINRFIAKCLCLFVADEAARLSFGNTLRLSLLSQAHFLFLPLALLYFRDNLCCRLHYACTFFRLVRLRFHFFRAKTAAIASIGNSLYPSAFRLCGIRPRSARLLIPCWLHPVILASCPVV